VASISSACEARGVGRNSDFRPIHYLGCKTSVTAAIKGAIDELDPAGGRLCDLFSGTGAVAGALGAEREVTTVDVQEYSRVLCAAVLAPPRLSTPEILRFTAGIAHRDVARCTVECLQPLIDYETTCIAAATAGDREPLAELLESPSLAASDEPRFEAPAARLAEAMLEVASRLKTAQLWESPDTTVSRHFGGVYFSFRQAVALDAILTAATASEAHLRDPLLAAALSTASQLVNTVGKQFAQPLRPRNKFGEIKPDLPKTVRRDRGLDTFAAYRTWLGRYAELPGAIGEPRALRADYLEVLLSDAADCSILYADPPYTRDHYSRFYHVLETMCLRDDPSVSRVTKGGTRTVSRGSYRADRHQSPFCIRSAAPAAFKALFEAARRRELPLVLSYSPHEAGDGTHPRVVSISQIMEIARSCYERVELAVVDGSIHSSLNRGDLKLKTREHAEILLKCYR